MNKTSHSKQNRFARVIGSRPVLVAGALATVYLAGGLFGVPALLQWQLPQQVESRLGATLELGKVYFNPFTLVLELRDINLRTRREGALLSADRLRIDFELSSLWHRAWTFADILLDQPTLTLELDKDGKLNLQPLLDAMKSPQDQKKGAPPRLLLQRLVLRNGSVNYTDASLTQPLVTHLYPLSIEATDLTTIPSRTGSIRFSARSEAGEILKGAGTLGLQPFSAGGSLELSALKANTLARALHRQLPWRRADGSIALRSDWRFGMSGDALSGELDKLELTLTGLALAEPKGAAPAMSLDTARLLLPKTTLGFGSNSVRIDADAPELSLGAASVVASGASVQTPGASLRGKTVTLSTGANLALALQGMELALQRLQVKAAGNAIDVAAPALQAASLDMTQDDKGMAWVAQAPALSIRSMNRQGADGTVRLGAATLGARRLEAGSRDKAPFGLQAQAARLTLADAAWRRSRDADNLATLGNGTLDAAALKLSLPTSGAQLAASGMEAKLGKLLMKDPRAPGELAHVDAASMQGAALDLAARRVDLGTITLAGGAATLRVDKDGAFNWSALAAPSASTASTASSTPAARDASTAPTAPVASTAASASAAPAASATTSAAPDAAPASRGTAPSWRVTANSIALQRFTANLADARQTPAAALTLESIDATLANVDTAGRAPSQLRFAARSGAGSLSVDGSIGLSDGAGDLALKAIALPLQPVEPYLAGIGRLALASGTFSADGRLKLAGRGGAPMLAYTGGAALNGVAIDQTAPRQRFLSWKTMAAADMRLTLAPNRLAIGQLRIDGPVGELLIAQDGSVNVARVLGQDKAAKGDAAQKPVPAAAATDNAAAAQSDAADPFPVTISRLRVDNGTLTFADFSQQPQFSTKMRDLHGVMTGLSTVPGRRARLQFDAAIAEYGEARIEGSMNPFKPAYATDVRMAFRNVDMSALSPYVVRFAGYEVNSGTLAMDLHYQVEQSRLVGENRVVLDKVQLGKKVESEGALDIPLELALALLRDENGVIRIGVPVSGDLQNPQFSFGAVVRHALGNVLRNIVSAPFRALASLLKIGGGEELDSIGFDPGSASLAPPERQKLDRLAKALAQRPGVKLLVHPALNREADAAALRSLALRREVLTKMGVTLEPGEDPGPLNTSAPRVQRVIDALAAERLPDARGLKAPPGMAPDAWRDRLLERLIAVQPLPSEALAALQRERGEAVRAALTRQEGLPVERVALAQPEEADKLQDGEVPMRLELAAQETPQAQPAQ
ncbi:DUF748 domain-containing protein [Noviherbaspirillum pedocola]|uniref:DUF748 domain-containing protein n=1 Tax=Noviherbaspirillum pedocola TaxID=2801341 RepID=A0A934SQU6_9BURK|nr:DUF748 domain-containing protein [Noviherbaspirillum pedocola]MBK4733837.1 DUF748 domain-containing protein [Noviherbaspirillum pedocola]